METVCTLIVKEKLFKMCRPHTATSLVLPENHSHGAPWNSTGEEGTGHLKGSSEFENSAEPSA